MFLCVPLIFPVGLFSFFNPNFYARSFAFHAHKQYIGFVSEFSIVNFYPAEYHCLWKTNQGNFLFSKNPNWKIFSLISLKSPIFDPDKDKIL